MSSGSSQKPQPPSGTKPSSPPSRSGGDGAPKPDHHDLIPAQEHALGEPVTMSRENIVRQYELIERVKAYDPDLDEDLLNRAYVVAMVAHGGQTRKNGDPYFTHPIAVAMILTELKVDPLTIATALLHDTVEDTDVTIDEIKDKFGGEIAHLVDGVTKLSNLELVSTDTAQAENFQKFLVAVAQDVRVLLVKLADRLHNMRTLHFVPNPEKRRAKALETMEIYVPLAGRIGVQKLGEELADLCFLYMNPEGYHTIKQKLELMSKTAVPSIIAFAQNLRDMLKKNSIKAEVYSREKTPFSIWRKMQRKGVAFEELADIYAFRIIVETVEDCYRTLGAVHSAYPMIHGEFDDYISTPKPNNYQSLHTAVLAQIPELDQRQRVEIQIRTRDMHEHAERGIAAHWKYKDSSAKGKDQSVEIVSSGKYDPYEWMRAALEMLRYGDNAAEFFENAKMELFSDQVFCFTPRGRVIALPKGATTLDFAYAVHTELGDGCVGAQINGVLRPLRTELHNGDVVEVKTSTSAPVPKDWRSLVVTGRAKSAMTRRIKRMKEEDLIAQGRHRLESELNAHGIPLTDQAIQNALGKLGLASSEAVYKAVGRMELSVRKVREAAYPGVVEDNFKKRRDNGQSTFTGDRRPLPVEGVETGATVVLSPCCSPLPGERIVGLPEPDGTIMVHRLECDALEETDLPESQWKDLHWRDELTTAFIGRIKLSLNNRRGVLAEVAEIFARYDADVLNIRLENREADFTDMILDVEVIDAKHLLNVLTGLRAAPNVLSAERRQVKPVEMADEQLLSDVYKLDAD